ncbi:MAG: sensor histidine kinase [Isosphaeraceae bacterium]
MKFHFSPLSLQRRIFLMLLACVALCALVLSLLADIEFRNRGPAMFHHGSLRFFAAEFERLWKSGKAEEIQLQINQLGEIQHSRFQWLDKNGKDLLGNDNFSEIRLNQENEIEKRGGPRGRRGMRDNRIEPVFSYRTGNAGFLAISPSAEFYLVHWVPPPRPWPAMPLFLSITAILVVFGILISRNIAKPVTRLSQTMDQFGAGELAARSDIQRSDEIGQLASSFNAMASRIETDFSRERRMVRNMAHEVRTPLTRMLRLRERISSGRNTIAAIEQMESEIQQLSRMPEKLMELSDIEQGRAKMEHQPVDIQLFLESTIEKMQLIASDKKCYLKFNFNSISDSDDFSTDSELLAHAVENIIDNAIRHCPENSEIIVHCENQPNDRMTIEISDTGPGVPEEDLQRIFNPFFRTDQSRNQKTGGLGLGLAISKSIIAALGGSIEARNNNPGLTITITLPACFHTGGEDPDSRD